MIYRCAEIMTAWLVKYNAIDSEDKELYEYAIFSILFTFSPLLLSIIIGLLIGRLWECVVLIIPFLFIRKFSGGFHAKKAWICLICSSTLLVFCTIVSSYIEYGLGLAMVTLAAITILVLCSPIDSESRRLSQEEKKSCKIATIIITFFFAFIDLILYLLQKETYAVCISLGIILTAGLQIPCLFHRTRSK